MKKQIMVTAVKNGEQRQFANDLWKRLRIDKNVDGAEQGTRNGWRPVEQIEDKATIKDGGLPTDLQKEAEEKEVVKTAPSYSEILKEIKASDSIEYLEELIENDDRKPIKLSAAKRIKELTPE